jgi:hypothetical protein
MDEDEVSEWHSNTEVCIEISNMEALTLCGGHSHTGVWIEIDNILLYVDRVRSTPSMMVCVEIP